MHSQDVHSAQTASSSSSVVPSRPSDPCPRTTCVAVALQREEPHESVPELLVDAAVDDEVDGGVEDEEDVVGRVQVVDVGGRVEPPKKGRGAQLLKGIYQRKGHYDARSVLE